MVKPVDKIYLHFLDYYHPLRSRRDNLAATSAIRLEAKLAFRIAVLLSELSIVPASSFFESTLCRRILNEHADFRYYGCIKLSAREPSLLDHIEAKQTKYDDDSPEDLVRAYRSKWRTPLPGYVPKRASSTEVIIQGWREAAETDDIRKIIDPIEIRKLPREIEEVWANVPDLLGERAFVPAHVIDVMEGNIAVLPSEQSISNVVEPLYIGGYVSDFGAAIIIDLPYLTSPFEEQLSGRKKISFNNIVEHLQALHLLDFVEQCRSRELFRLRCHSQWDVLASELVSGVLPSKESLERAEFIRDYAVMKDNVNHIDRSKPKQMVLGLGEYSDVQVGVVTALPEEFVAVEMAIDDPEEISVQGDPNRYLIGTVKTTEGIRRVVVTQLSRMRNDSAASGGTNLIRSFPNLRVLFMCGIALAIPSPNNASKHVRLGDVVVSDRKGIIQFDHIEVAGDATTSSDTETNRSNLPPPSAAATRALNRLEQLELKGERPWLEHLEKIQGRLSGYGRPAESADVLLDEVGAEIPHPSDDQREPGVPRVFRGPIASGNTLVRSAGLREKIKKAHGVLAIEMEGAGTAEAAWQFDRFYMVIRSSCDYGSPKDDRWHRYAAACAAAYTRALIEGLHI